MCNGYNYFESLVSAFSMDWAYLSEIIVQDVLYLVFDLGAELDVLNVALKKPVEEVAEEVKGLEEETTFQVDVDGEPKAMLDQLAQDKPNFYEAGQSIGRIVGRLFNSIVDIGA